MLRTLLLLFVCLTGLTGCSTFSKDITVHVVEGHEYHEEKDAAGKVTFICLTPGTFQEIAKARLRK